MEFTSIDDIKDHFGIETDDIEEIRKQLKIMLAELHPDKNGGEYRNRKQQRDYEEVSNAINLIDNSNTSLVLTRSEWTSVLQKIEDLAIFKTKNDFITEDEISKQLDTSINTSVIRFQKKHFSYKVSSIVTATIITTLWAFPSIVEGHRILKRLIFPDSLGFTIFWLTSLALTSLIWLYAKTLEKKDDVIKKSYNLESTQNSIFKLFLAWLRSAYPHSINYSTEIHKHSYSFTKDDIVNFVLNYYKPFYREFNSDLSSTDYDLYQTVNQFFDKDKKRVIDFAKQQRRNRRLFLIFKEPGEIDIELAQKIAEVIIGKLVTRKLVTLSDKKTFSETYTFYGD
jgi:hypothetical protein